MNKKDVIRKMYLPLGSKPKQPIRLDNGILERPSLLSRITLSSPALGNVVNSNNVNFSLPDIYTTCPELSKFQPEEKPALQQIQNDFDPKEEIIDPHALEFIPKEEWKPRKRSLEELRDSYFSRRNGVARHFHYKLSNALKITKQFPSAYKMVGAISIGQNMIKINSNTFGSLLGIHAVQGGLFHKQGNFSRNGYKQIQKQKIDQTLLIGDVDDVDDYNVRIFLVSSNDFKLENPNEI